MHKTEQGTGLKILTPKQMLQRLPIALAQVNAGNNSENLLTRWAGKTNIFVFQSLTASTPGIYSFLKN